ncbi:MAG: hypothetical protein QY323_02535 [Patescibacteria group bacterium]|nr:MAG: hypothetical protein QY323_02535 [Patescibacteria group bacterium]
MTTRVETRREESDVLWIVLAVIAYVAMGLIGGFNLATFSLLPLGAVFGLTAFAGRALKGKQGLCVPAWEQAKARESVSIESEAAGAERRSDLQAQSDCAA